MGYENSFQIFNNNFENEFYMSNASRDKINHLSNIPPNFNWDMLTNKYLVSFNIHNTAIKPHNGIQYG